MRKRVVRKESRTLTDARGLRTLRAMMKEESGDLFEGGPAERVVIGL
ncbi:MAG: hypothetical protein LC679_15925 [Intrasporangiaceae bacterium]|nr:hypothetical protein [Intrasporangiaceae bacterium]